MTDKEIEQKVPCRYEPTCDDDCRRPYGECPKVCPNYKPYKSINDLEKENAELKEEIRRLKTIIEIKDKEIEELKKCTRCITCENIYKCKVNEIERELEE